MTSETNDPVELYLNEVAKVPPLSDEEETALFQRIRGDDRDEAAKRRLIENRLAMVVDIANQYSSAGIPRLELLQEGNIGLMKAVQMFAKNPVGEFSPYAAALIETEIRRAIADRNEREDADNER
jgi:RNA polymerase primary sigma factor